MELKNYNDLLIGENDDVFDYLTRVLPYYQAMKSHEELDGGVNLARDLDASMKRQFENDVCNSIYSACEKSASRLESKLGNYGEADDLCINGYANVWNNLYKYDSSRGKFSNFLSFYMKRAVSETIKENTGLSRNDQSYNKIINQIIDDLVQRNNTSYDIITVADIAFELQDRGMKPSLEKIERFLSMRKGNIAIDDYDENLYLPEKLTEDFKESAILFDVEEHWEKLLSYFGQFNDAEKFLYFAQYNEKYKDMSGKEIAEDKLFVDICLNNKKTRKNVVKNAVKTDFIYNRQRDIKKAKTKLINEILNDGYGAGCEEKFLELWNAVLLNEVVSFYDDISRKYGVDVNKFILL